MKKTHWLRTTLITLVACGIAGLILAVILFNANPPRTGVSSSIEFSFEHAAEGLSPNGARYDLSGLTSDDVLNAALKDAGLDGQYTAEDLRANLIVSGIYPKDIADRMSRYESVLDGDINKVTVEDFHATLYSVTLYNDFDKNISRENLESLLTAVMSEFRAYFEKTYSVFLSRDNLLDNLSDYDYPQQLEVLDGSITRLEDFAKEMAEAHPEFLADGQGFADVAVRFEGLRTTDLERISGMVTMNALSRDQERIVAQYENQIKVLEIQLKEQKQEAKDTEELINQYTKDDIIYVSTTGALQQVGSNSTQTYDTLVARRREIEDSIADLNKQVAQLQLKLSDIQSETVKTETPAAETEEGETTAAESAAAEAPALTEEEREAQRTLVEKGIAGVVTKLNTVTENFAALLQAYSSREMNDRTVAVTAVRYDAPKLLSGTFLKQAIKTAGPLCALGLMVCLAGLIVSRWRRRNG
jgi:hypothetical protein